MSAWLSNILFFILRICSKQSVHALEAKLALQIIIKYIVLFNFYTNYRWHDKKWKYHLLCSGNFQFYFLTICKKSLEYHFHHCLKLSKCYKYKSKWFTSFLIVNLFFKNLNAERVSIYLIKIKMIKTNTKSKK